MATPGDAGFGRIRHLRMLGGRLAGLRLAPMHAGLRYALAAAAVGLGALLRWEMPEVLGSMPYLAFYPAVVASAAFGGAGPGLLATFGSALCVHLFFVAPYGHLDVFEPLELLRIVIFVVSGVGISMVAGMWQTARARERRQAAEVVRSRAELAEINATLEQRAEQLRHLAVELTQAEQRERRRVAAVLHDHLQQLLVAARLQVGVARKGPDPRASLPSVDDLLSEALAATRSLTAELSPSILHTGRLSEALQWLAQWVADKHGLTVQVEADAAVDLPEDVRTMLFQAARELLFNVVKHAGVERATLHLCCAGEGEARLTVADEGAGSDPTLFGQARADGGFGLHSIRERLELLGGRMEVDTTPGRGTRVTLVVPQPGETLPAGVSA